MLTVEGDDARRFADALLLAEFAEDNPENFGPTATIVPLFYYSGGTVVAVPRWPNGRFQITRGGRQFLV